MHIKAHYTHYTHYTVPTGRVDIMDTFMCSLTWTPAAALLSEWLVLEMLRFHKGSLEKSVLK